MKVVVPLTIAAVGLGVAANVAAGGGFGLVVWNVHRAVDWFYRRLVGSRKVALSEAPICARCGSVMELRARHVQHARVVPDEHADMAVVLSCPHCHGEGAQLTGTEAVQVLRQGLTYLSVVRRGRQRAEDAAREVDKVGGPEWLVRDVAFRQTTLRALRPERRLAFEMAVDEQAEAEELERQWRGGGESGAQPERKPRASAGSEGKVTRREKKDGG